ncbi:MAG TPA: SDR family oxidoreductase [Sediminibacterium sp.]|uniref:SDR family oxidoreductase n=1 Tax=Sediminibacterium sp. TaxID=1917865 RepID=UPI0026CB0EFA|nr:SDR family oxidoreductase [Sediminibacterium sp.]HLD52473.1 SDR family oxidoreductase [Sediminibacterium sp.]
MSWDLQNKTAIVTGGTKGIGWAIVNEFLHLGANVIVIARNEEDMASSLAEWYAKGFNVKGIIADITAYDTYESILIQIDLPAIDILVNNVGGNFPKKFLEYTQKDIESIFNLNLFSNIRFTQLLFDKLKAANGAVIINISSIAGLEDVGTGSLYAVCKAAIIQLTKSLAIEWAPFSIRVNSVAPWFTATHRINTLLQDQSLKDFVITNTPLKTIARPVQIAHAVSFLAMESANYITGETIVVDGGFSTQRKV